MTDSPLDGKAESPSSTKDGKQQEQPLTADGSSPAQVVDSREEVLTADLESATSSIDRQTEAIEKVTKDQEAPWFARLGEAGITVGLVSLLLVLRLFAVADWNWDVAASLADSFNFDDAFSIILGTLFERPTVSGLLIAIALPLAFFRDYWLSKKGISSTRANNWFLIAALLATAYVLTRSFQIWWLFAVAAVLTLALITAAMLVRAKGWNHTFARLGAHVGAALGIALLLLASTIDTPWVQREEIQTIDGSFYGYVLDADPGFLKVLTEDREVLIIPDADVEGRMLAPEPE